MGTLCKNGSLADRDRKDVPAFVQPALAFGHTALMPAPPKPMGRSKCPTMQAPDR